MNPLITLLIEFLVGAALAWLRERLKSLPPLPHAPSEAVAVGQALAKVRASLTWWDYFLRRHRQLDRVEALLLPRASDFVRAARGEVAPPVMTGAEYAAVVE